MSSPQEGIIFLHFLKIFESMSIHCLDTSPVIVIFNWDLYCTVSGLLTKTMFTTHDCFFNVKVLRNGKSNKSKECQCLVVNTENTFNGLKTSCFFRSDRCKWWERLKGVRFALITEHSAVAFYIEENWCT